MLQNATITPDNHSCMPSFNSPTHTPSLESKYLSGKVVKWSLPTFEPPFSPDAPATKRLLLPQGELAQIFDSEEPARYISCLELMPGTVRGNHYHKLKRESVYVMRGELSLVVRDVESGARETVSVKAGELVSIGVGIAHAMVVVTAGLAVEFAPVRFNPGDIHRYPCAAV